MFATILCDVTYLKQKRPTILSNEKSPDGYKQNHQFIMEIKRLHINGQIGLIFKDKFQDDLTQLGSVIAAVTAANSSLPICSSSVC
jgi:hypothetical protein